MSQRFVDPHAIALAAKLTDPQISDPIIVAFSRAQENDWTLMISFIVDCFLECMRIVSNLEYGEHVEAREQANLVEMPRVLTKIRQATGIDISVLDTTDIVDGSSLPATKEQIDALPAKALVRGKHWPLSRWFYVNKDLGVILTFARQWRVVGSA